MITIYLNPGWSPKMEGMVPEWIRLLREALPAGYRLSVTPLRDTCKSVSIDVSSSFQNYTVTRRAGEEEYDILSGGRKTRAPSVEGVAAAIRKIEKAAERTRKKLL